MKPWHTREWREMRKRRIGDTCEQCNSSVGPFVLQHFSHEERKPPSKTTMVWALMREYGSYPPRPTVRRPACPQCKRRALSERKKLKPRWRCIACHHEFDESIMVEVPINNRTEKGEYDRYRQEVLFPAFDDFVAAHQDVVDQRYGAILAEYEKERQASNEEYMSGEGTATFCKKCAFLWDVKGMELCSNCREQYHLFAYQTCFNCLPSERKEEIRETREFVEEMEEFSDGIDELYADASEQALPTTSA